MLVTVKTAWLFTRGSQSIRIVRAAARDGAMHLLVQGPGESSDSREFTDVVACMTYQSELERRLVAEGYALERFTSDRRAAEGPRRPGTPERRRVPPIFL